MTARAKPGTARRVLDDAMSEEDWQREVLGYADAGSWLVFHALPATVYRRGARRTLTHQLGDPGWPDLALARDRTLLLAEIKSERGALAEAQKAWAAHLGALWVCWRPRDRESVRATLLAPRGPDRVDVVPPRLRPRLPTNSGTPKRSTFDFEAVGRDDRRMT